MRQRKKEGKKERRKERKKEERGRENEEGIKRRKNYKLPSSSSK